MIIDYQAEIKRQIYYAYINVLNDLVKKYGTEWAGKQKVTPQNRETLARLTKSEVLEKIADPMEEEKVDPIVVNCDKIIRLTLLDPAISEMLDEFEKEGVMIGVMIK